MLTVDVATTPPSASDAAVVAVGVFAAASGEPRDPIEPTDAASTFAEAAGIDVSAELMAAGFRAGVGELLRVPVRGGASVRALFAVGLGPRSDVGAEELRCAVAAAVNAAERVPSAAMAFAGAVGPLGVAETVEAVVEGALLGGYRFDAYQSKPSTFELERVDVLVDPSDEEVARTAVQAARISAGATLLTRDLVNTPPQDKRPPVLAERAATEVAGHPIDVRILDEEALAEGGYGGILGVGQGSSQPPRLVELTYAPADATRHVVLVGKGITFDTGGISLKPSASMETMKTDMAGAATVLAVVKAASELKLPVKITGLMALAENMPSGTATRVSDVLTMRGGTTVEVINTDAEGRLVLGDALVHASELGPDAIVDVATLTGAAVVALGDRIGLLMSSDDALAEALLAAGERVGERHWPMPVATKEYAERVQGSIADLKNAGGREAGSIFAGLFLHHFVGDGIPWAHLDIAGTAWTATAQGYQTVGATGVPARTLLAWLNAQA